MAFLKVNDIPKIKFAHVFSADKYLNLIKATKNRIEISYVSSGNYSAEIDEKKQIAKHCFFHIASPHGHCSTRRVQSLSF